MGSCANDIAFHLHELRHADATLLLIVRVIRSRIISLENVIFVAGRVFGLSGGKRQQCDTTRYNINFASASVIGAA